MKCDDGQLQAYLDNALPPQEGAKVSEHLDRCTRCQEALAHLRQQGAEAGAHLRALDPQQAAKPAPALARFWKQVRPAAPRASRPAWTAHWRPALVGVSLVAILALLLSIAPVRQAAAEFLGLFRVRKFAVIPVDPARLEQLSGLEDLVKEALGGITTLREPGPPQKADDVAAAAALAGFPVRTPAYLPAGATLLTFTVETGPAMRVEVKRDLAEALLQAAGVEGVNLPDAETFSIDANLAAMVTQSYKVDGGMVMFLQTPSPEVTLPSGIEPERMGEALLQFLGMSPEDARRVAQEIDWTSTLVIPLPTNVAQFREVTVDGVTGLLLVANGTANAQEPDNIVLWQRDDMIYVVAGNNLPPEQLLQVADSLR
jgi:hypothetical protein